jgi:hypothetical protein
MSVRISNFEIRGRMLFWKVCIPLDHYITLQSSRPQYEYSHVGNLNSYVDYFSEYRMLESADIWTSDKRRRRWRKSRIWDLDSLSKIGGYHLSLYAIVAQPTNCPVGVNTTTELKKVTITCYYTGTLVSWNIPH